MTAGALAVGLTFAAAPVGAGQACQRLGLDSPCIKSNDLKARILRAWSSRSAISADSAALGCWRAARRVL